MALKTFEATASSPAFENTLKTKNVSYDQFLFITNVLHDRTFLDNTAVVSLARNGALHCSEAKMLAALFPVLLIAAPVMFIWLPFFFPLISVAAAFLCRNRSKKLLEETAWKELTGKGNLSYEERKVIYEILVKHDALWSEDPTLLEGKSEW